MNPAAIARGAAGGLLATGAMSLVMLASRRLGLVGELAPEHITADTLDAAGVDRDEDAQDATSTVAHVAFGTANGALFALVRPGLPGPPVARGLLFAAALLLVSYEGWVPATGILPPLRAQTPGGRWTLITSHIAYGITLGVATDVSQR